MRWQSRWPDGGPGGRVKGLLSWSIYSTRELDNSSKPNTELGQKAARQRKIPLLRKSYSLYIWVILQKGVDEVGEEIMSENQLS
jgi:hypothetical protein